MTDCAPTSAAAVANEFLALQESDPGHPLIDQMKLQKLVFYAHAWYMALNNRALFEDDVQAWPWGPVVRNIYGDFRKFGRSAIIGKKATALQKSGPGPLDYSFVTPQISDPALKQFIRDVWDVHKKYTGIQLSNSTHSPGEPWTIIKDQYGGDLNGKPMIPNELIEGVFKSKLGDGATN